MDALLLFSAHGELRDDRLGIFGSGGGVGMTASDAVARASASTSCLGAKTIEKLNRLSVLGTGIANPLDVAVGRLNEGDHYVLEETADLLKCAPSVASIICTVETGLIMDFADSEVEDRTQFDDISASIQRSRSDGANISLGLRSAGDQLQDDFVREQRVLPLPARIAVFGSTAQALRSDAILQRMTRPLMSKLRTVA